MPDEVQRGQERRRNEPRMRHAVLPQALLLVASEWTRAAPPQARTGGEARHVRGVSFGWDGAQLWAASPGCVLRCDAQHLEATGNVQLHP